MIHKAINSKWDEAIKKMEPALTKKKIQEKTNSGNVNDITVKRIIEDLRNASKGNEEEVMVLVAILLQKGATSKKQLAKTTEEINGVYITTGMLRNACSSHKITVRKLARALSKDIIEIMQSMKDHAYPGNLGKKYLTEKPEATLDELIWASDFQTFNPDCPEKIREWLMTDFNSRFKKDQ
jgi:hypothetical protein